VSTDAAFAALSDSAQLEPVARRYQDQLVTGRAQIDNAQDLTTALSGAYSLESAMSVSENAQSTTAVKTSVVSSSDRASGVASSTASGSGKGRKVKVAPFEVVY
jgi:hypothetical protein